MDCKSCREALSARLDNEEEFASSAAVDDHLSECPACRRWQAEAIALTRALRVRPAVKTPDLVAEVLGAVQAIPARGTGTGEESQAWPGSGA
ncbi:zf-HC2 domain-containing protein [Mycobacterium sp. SM1]|uniref:zf-HC2 domain-containing protein n=1 Tax=Mycobacterium sp. SM1 TaxID=2816243 RepID=UPI001BCF9A66|nr:zf-HC2 domain-containing protein [Mycobacterium sp. SM1]MBS4727709.1 zf-HC2 domain-containing protein [Mycobacterium sp. SM1]